VSEEQAGEPLAGTVLARAVTGGRQAPDELAERC